MDRPCLASGVLNSIAYAIDRATACFPFYVLKNWHSDFGGQNRTLKIVRPICLSINRVWIRLHFRELIAVHLIAGYSDKSPGRE